MATILKRKQMKAYIVVFFSL